VRSSLSHWKSEVTPPVGRFWTKRAQVTLPCRERIDLLLAERSKLGSFMEHPAVEARVIFGSPIHRLCNGRDPLRAPCSSSELMAAGINALVPRSRFLRHFATRSGR
jgi:hypothetical protein